MLVHSGTILSSPALAILVALAVAVGTLMAYFRTSVSKVWRDTSEGWQARAELYEMQNAELEARVQTLEIELAELRGKTDLSGFESRQIERDRAMLEPLEKLVDQVGRLAVAIENGNGHGDK